MGKSFLIRGPGIWADAVLDVTARELRRRKDRRKLKEEVQRWEDEGGNVLEVRTVSPRPK